MRKPLIICIVLALAGAVTASLAMAATPAPRIVKVGDNWFYKSSPRVPTINVKRNTTVKFKFVGDDPHNIIGYRGSTKKFSSSIKSSGYYNKKLTTTGTFKIVCDIHGDYDQSMKIKVVNP